MPCTALQFRAWLSVKAVRDMASGFFIFVLLVAATPQVLGWFMLAAAGIHGATAVVMLAISVLLFVA